MDWLHVDKITNVLVFIVLHKSYNGPKPLNISFSVVVEILVPFLSSLLSQSLSLHLSLCISWGKSWTVGRVLFGVGMGSKGKGRQKKASIQSPIILYSWSPMCFYYLNYSPSTESSILSHCEAIIWGAISTEAKKSYLWNTDYLKWDRRASMEGNTRFHRLPCPTGGLWTFF